MVTVSTMSPSGASIVVLLYYTIQELCQLSHYYTIEVKRDQEAFTILDSTFYYEQTNLKLA